MTRRRYRRYEHYRPVSFIWPVGPMADLLFNSINCSLDKLGSYRYGPGGVALTQGTVFNSGRATPWLYYLTACYGIAYNQHATRYWSPL